MGGATPYPRGDTIVESIYDCVVHPARWHATLEILRLALGGRVGVLGVIGNATRETRLSVATGEQALVQPLIEDYKDEIPFLLAAPRLEFDVAYTIDTVYPVLSPGTQERWRSARVTQEFVLPNALDDFLWLTLAKQSARTGSLVILTGRDKQITAEDLQWLQSVAPHLRRAVTIGDLFDAERDLAEAFRRLVELLTHAVLIVTLDMRVIFANAAAEMILNERVVARLSGGRLAFPFSPAERGIARAVVLGQRDEVALGAAGINVPLASAEVPAIAHVLPLARRDPTARFADSAAAAIFVSVAGVTPTPAVEAIAALFGLTPAEKRVVSQVARGKSRKEIALSQGVSDDTVKTQLAAIFDKTGAHDQRRLALLIREISPPVVAPSQN